MKNKLRAIIIDDEPRSITTMQWELSSFEDQVETIATCTEPLKAKDLILKHKPDVIFLDIEMPHLNGIDLVKSFDKVPCSVIFTTAYDKFAIQAFEISAIDYLLKPINGEDLNRAINKLINKDDSRYLEQQFTALFENITAAKTGFKKIVIPVQEGFEFVNLEDILRCEANANYTKIFLVSGRMIFISKSLKEVEGMISDTSFCRVHQSHLVNLRYISKYQKGKGGSITLSDGSLIPVSRSRRDDFLGQL